MNFQTCVAIFTFLYTYCITEKLSDSEQIEYDEKQTTLYSCNLNASFSKFSEQDAYELSNMTTTTYTTANTAIDYKKNFFEERLQYLKAKAQWKEAVNERKYIEWLCICMIRATACDTLYRNAILLYNKYFIENNPAGKFSIKVTQCNNLKCGWYIQRWKQFAPNPAHHTNEILFEQWGLRYDENEGFVKSNQPPTTQAPQPKKPSTTETSENKTDNPSLQRMKNRHIAKQLKLVWFLWTIKNDPTPVKDLHPSLRGWREIVKHYEFLDSNKTNIVNLARIISDATEYVTLKAYFKMINVGTLEEDIDILFFMKCNHCLANRIGFIRSKYLPLESLEQFKPTTPINFQKIPTFLLSNASKDFAEMREFIRMYGYSI